MPVWQFLFRPGRWQLTNFSFPLCNAESLHRAIRTAWARARAMGCTEVHLCLDVVRQIRPWQLILCYLPELAFSLHVARKAGNAEHSCEYALYVTVQYGDPGTKAKRGNGICGGSAYPRQICQSIRFPRKLPAQFKDDFSGTAVQVAGSGVVAQTTPQRHDFAGVGLGQGLQGWKSVQEPVVIRDDRTYLGLLQHDLGKPYRVWVLAGLPWQVVAPMLTMPAQQTLRELAHA